jgi:hypothetical protein
MYTALLTGSDSSAPSKQAGQPAANNGVELVPILPVRGVESLISRLPSELRDTPCSRPPVVCVLPVYITLVVWVIVSIALNLYL